MINNQLNKLKLFWNSSKIFNFETATPKDIQLFYSRTNLILPEDLGEYFQTLNGTNEDYDENLFKFYSLSQFKKINETYKDWKGVPEYGDIVYSFKNYENCFVFADYSFSIFAYALKLYPRQTETNEVYIISGGVYKIIANSFKAFLDLYLKDSPLLYFN
jgi:hypothetical protein